MPTINETVNASMQAAGMTNYRQQATPVVEALIEREQRLFTGIVSAAREADLNPAQVTQMLAGLGMAMPSEMEAGLRAVSEPVAQMNTATAAQPPFGTETQEDDLLRRVASLEEFARRAGYTG